jgi:3-mercaptopyruvate sulfurtransferase SseA
MKFCSLRKVYLFIVMAMIAAVLSLVSACGGGGDYDPSLNENPPLYPWWDNYNKQADTLVSVNTLDTWIANGFKTETGAPVVIIDISSAFGTDATIPGSFKGADVGYVNSEVRDEGPLKTSEAVSNTASQMVFKGETVDTILSKIGATHDTVIVFVQKSGVNTSLARIWQMFYYWGLSEANLKILDGKVPNVATAAVGQNWAAVKSGDFSVKQLPELHGSARISTAEVLQALQNDSAIIWDSWGSHNSGKSKISKNRFFYSFGNCVDSTEGDFNDPQEVLDGILAAMIDPANGLNTAEGLGTILATGTDEEKKAAALNLLKTKKIITHCQAGNAAAPAYYFAKELLPAFTGNNNVAMYDGSWSAWVVHTEYSPLNTAYAQGKLTQFDTSPYTVLTGTEEEFLNYAAKFWCRTNPDNGTCYDPVTVDINYDGDGRDLFWEDYDYLESRESGSGNDNEAVGGGGAAGGC